MDKREAARIIGVSLAEMDRLIRWGEVLTCRVNGSRSVPLSEVDLARRRRQAPR